jgi:hypothetical protein
MVVAKVLNEVFEGVLGESFKKVKDKERLWECTRSSEAGEFMVDVPSLAVIVFETFT